MTDHISYTALAIGLLIMLVVKSTVLTAFLWIMIQIQKFRYDWLPLIGSAILASALDFFPLVGHYIAASVLYFCIWKITRASLFPEAVFTVGLSYACMYTLTLILMAYAPVPSFHSAKSTDNDSFDSDTNFPSATAAEVQPTNQMAQITSTPQNTVATGISIHGFSGTGNNTMVTIRYGRKSYILSLNEGVTIPTDEGSASVRFVEVGTNNVTLAVNGQNVKYAVR